MTDIGVPAHEALELLIEGNRHFAGWHLLHPNQSLDRLRQCAVAQQPFAVILGCSDSRVPPEIIFDRGLGDLFVIRTAGHVVDEAVLASIEFALVKLGVRLVVVLGHMQCGAVITAAESDGQEIQGHLGCLVEKIRPSFDEEGQGGVDIDRAVIANVQRTVTELHSSKPVLAAMVLSEGLKIVGASYDITTGIVTWLEPD